MCSGWGVTYKTGFGVDGMIGFIVPYSHNAGLQEIHRDRRFTYFYIYFTITHALGFSAFSSRILATDL
jgi:hypothetical protein